MIKIIIRMMGNLDLHNKANKENNLDLPHFIVSTTALLKWFDFKKGNKYKQKISLT